MGYREVTMTEVREILRQWLSGAPRKRIAARLSCDAKTVRRYVRAAERLGLVPGGAEQTVGDEMLAAVIAAACPQRRPARGQGWARCEAHREFIAAKLAGARFALLKGFGARLSRALVNFFLDLHTQKHGYQEVLPPFLVISATLPAIVHLPHFAADLFKA